MNTRQYPSTLNEAFPRTADYASSIERSRGYSRAWWIAMGICSAFAVYLVWTLK